MCDVLDALWAEMGRQNFQVCKRCFIASQPANLSIAMIFSRDKFSFLINSGKLTKRQPVAFDSLFSLIVKFVNQLLEFFFRLSLIFSLTLYAAPLACLIYVSQASKPSFFSGGDDG